MSLYSGIHSRCFALGFFNIRIKQTASIHYSKGLFKPAFRFKMVCRLVSLCSLVILILSLLSLSRSDKDDSFLNDQSLPLKAVSADEAELHPRQICIEWKRRKGCRKRKRNLFLKRLLQVSAWFRYSFKTQFRRLKIRDFLTDDSR